MKKKYPIKTTYGSFQTVIWFDKRDKVYLAEVPAFENALTQGSTLAQVKKMAADLIELLAEEALSEGKAVIDDERHIYARGKLMHHSGPIALVV